MKDNLVEICKNHLLIPEDKCLICKIGEKNKKKSCYIPILLNREYEGKSAKRTLSQEKHHLTKDSENYPLFNSPDTPKKYIILPKNYSRKEIEEWLRKIIDGDKPLDYYSAGQERDEEFYNRFKTEDEKQNQ